MRFWSAWFCKDRNTKEGLANVFSTTMRGYISLDTICFQVYQNKRYSITGRTILLLLPASWCIRIVDF